MNQVNIEEVKQMLTSFLVTNKQRRTSERYMILEEVFKQSDHFDIDTLYNIINHKKHLISRATLYNTMELLVEAHLVNRHHFGTNVAFYEKAYNTESHHHLICDSCGKVTEIKDSIIQEAIKKKEFHNFTPSHYHLYVYGTCERCQKKENPLSSTTE